MKRFKRNEKGFTLIELLVAIPIIGLLSLATGAVLIQLLHSDRISNRMVAVRQVQAAGDRVSQDAIQAQQVTLVGDITSPSGWSLNLIWSGEWTDDNGDYIVRKENVTYTLVSANGLYELQRHEVAQITVNSDTEDRDITNTVADHLDASQMSFEWQDSSNRALVFRVVSVVGTKTEERTYNIAPRTLG
jgi:prepilin-type N-terminal cleavage/methylation domain-containing protein